VKTFRLFIRRLAILATATTLGTAAVIALSATPAHATYPTIESSSTCDGPTGKWIVEWKVKNTWPQTARIKEVSVTPDGTTLTGGIVVDATLAQGASVTGQQIVTPGSAAFAKLTVRVRFSNGVESTKWKKEWFGDKCEQDKPQFEATPSSDCDSISVTVKNTGKIDISGTVSRGNESKAFSLAPNATSEPFDFAAGDGVVTVAVQGADSKTFTWQKPEDCPTPTTPPPTTTTPDLPVTGASLSTLIGVGGALVLVGMALLFVLRRRRLGES